VQHHDHDRDRDPKLDYTGMRPLSFVVDDMRARAEALMQSRQYEAAAAELAVLTTLAPRDLKIWLLLGYAQTRSGRVSQASEAYLQAAAIYAKRGYGRRALTLARRALELDPCRATPARLAPLVQRLGSAAAPLIEQATRTHLLLRRPDIARELLSMLLRADPKALDHRWQLIEVQLAEGEWVDAVDQLYVVAKGLLEQGRIGDYIRAAEMALLYGGPNAELLRELSRIYRRTGQRTEALSKLELLRRIDPLDPEALEMLARARLELGHVASAVAYVERLVGVYVSRNDRNAVRELLRRVSRWSDDDGLTREVERIRVSALVKRARRTTPPPPPLPLRAVVPLRAISGQLVSDEAHALTPVA
jgi:predicted Zn-dependent protease